MQEVGHLLPEFPQYHLDFLQQLLSVFFPFRKGHQPFISALAAIPCQYLVGNLAVRHEMRIFRPYLVPQLRRVLHHLHDILPLLRVTLA